MVSPLVAKSADARQSSGIQVDRGTSLEVYGENSQPAVNPLAPQAGPVQPRDNRQESARILTERGKELLSAKKYREAADAFTSALQVLPNYTPALNGRGIAYRHLRRPDDAIKDYDQVLRQNPKDKAATYNRALAYKDKGDDGAYARDVRAAAALGSELARQRLPMLPPESEGTSSNQVPAAPTTPDPSLAPPLVPPTPPAKANKGPAVGPAPALRPSPSPANAAAQWGGTWSVSNDWGTFTLTQQGARVTGKMAGGWAEGQISGSVNGNSITGTFQRDRSSHVDGQVSLTMAADGQSFTGKWKWNESPSWAASTFTGTRTAARGKSPSAPDLGAIVGVWYGVGFTVGTIEIKADGTYLFNGNPGGNYKFTPPNKIQFFGNLKAWDEGRAVFRRGNLEFEWKNRDGSINAFNFSRGR